jgi:hypothetical protein
MSPNPGLPLPDALKIYKNGDKKESKTGDGSDSGMVCSVHAAARRFASAMCSTKTCLHLKCGAGVREDEVSTVVGGSNGVVVIGTGGRVGAATSGLSA